MILDDEALVEQVARAIEPVLTTDNDIYWAAEYGRPIPQDSLNALALAAIEAVRVHMWDDGK